MPDPRSWLSKIWCLGTEDVSKRVRMISDQLFVTLYTLSIYPSVHKQPIRYPPNPLHPLYMNISCLGTWTPTACRRGAPAGGPPPPATQPPANYSSEDYPGRLTRNATNKQYLQKQTNNIYKKTETLYRFFWFFAHSMQILSIFLIFLAT